MLKADIAQTVQSDLMALLSPSCQAAGLSLKQMPDDASAGVIRTAMLIVFVAGMAANSSTVSQSPLTQRQVGMAVLDAYVIVLASSSVGPRSATWAAAIAMRQLDGATLACGAKVYCNSLQFTSYANGIWQYRLPLNIALPFSEAQQ